jgi:hypothetical protein
MIGRWEWRLCKYSVPRIFMRVGLKGKIHTRIPVIRWERDRRRSPLREKPVNRWVRIRFYLKKGDVWALYKTSWLPAPTLNLQPSPFFRPWNLSWSPVSQSKNWGNPAVSEYWSAWSRRAPVIVYNLSTVESSGERAVNETDVSGNESGFGFPARRDIIPGRFSNGYKLRTIGVHWGKYRVIYNLSMRRRTGTWFALLEICMSEEEQLWEITHFF